MLTMTKYVVHVSNLVVAAKTDQDGKSKVLLSGINFDLEAGKFIGVVGASGCGKSTLIKALVGQIATPSEGQRSAGGPFHCQH